MIKFKKKKKKKKEKIALAHIVVEGELNCKIRISRKTTKYSNVQLSEPFFMSFDNKCFEEN